MDSTILSILEWNDDITNIVWDNIYMSSNDHNALTRDDTKPLITYAEIFTDVSIGLITYFYQITVRADTKANATPISNLILQTFDRRKREEYAFSIVPKRTPIRDKEESLYGIAHDVTFITKKY